MIREEIRMAKKRIVQFESFSSIYNSKLQNELKCNKSFNESFELVTINLVEEQKAFEGTNGYRPYASIGKFKKIFYWIKFNKYLKCKYPYHYGDIVHIQYVSHCYLLIYPFLSSSFDKLILSFWGSDLLRQRSVVLKGMKLLFHKAKIITFETDQMKHIFQERVGKSFDKNIRLVKFGISALADIDNISGDDINKFKSNYGISCGSKYITIGYNRNKAHRHIEVLESMLKHKVPNDDVFIILPWTYGTEDDVYKRQIKNLIEGNYKYVFLEEKLSDKEIACLRCVTDILVQVQTTDSLSSTMLETLYAKNEVLTGSWLPYKELFDLGISMKLVDDTKSVGIVLNEMINKPLNYEARYQNKKLIYSVSSWEENINRWIDLYK